MRAYRKYLIRMGLVWAGSLVFFVLILAAVILPQMKAKAEVLRDSAEKQQQYEAAVSAAQEETKKRLAQEVDDLKSKLGTFVAEFEESANVTFDISRIAGDKNVYSFTVKTPDQSRDTSGQLECKYLQENKIEISFGSNFSQFAALLNALERHHPVVFVDRFKLVRDESSAGAAKVDMDLSIFVKKRQEG